MDIKEYKSIEFLNKLANMLSKRISPLTMLSSLKKLFKTYLSVDSVELIVWDNNNFQLQDFIQDYKENECRGTRFLY